MLEHVLVFQQVLGESLKLTDRESWDSKDGMSELKEASCFESYEPIDTLGFKRVKKNRVGYALSLQGEF